MFMFYQIMVQGLDNYTGESILFMDEFKGDIDYQTFLKLLDV